MRDPELLMCSGYRPCGHAALYASAAAPQGLDRRQANILQKCGPSNSDPCSSQCYDSENLLVTALEQGRKNIFWMLCLWQRVLADLGMLRASSGVPAHPLATLHRGIQQRDVGLESGEHEGLPCFRLSELDPSSFDKKAAERTRSAVNGQSQRTAWRTVPQKAQEWTLEAKRMQTQQPYLNHHRAFLQARVCKTSFSRVDTDRRSSAGQGPGIASSRRASSPSARISTCLIMSTSL